MKYLIMILFSGTLLSFAQNKIIDDYINVGIKNNLALQQQEFSLQQSLEDLNIARGMFFPSIDIKARYTRAGGGRDIDILVGDLVNPIHSALNFVNPQFGFPGNIQNEKIPFLRSKEHETKISLVQPIIQPSLFYNYSIKNNLVEIKKLEKNIYKRNLIFEIKTAYLSILKTDASVILYKNTMKLLEENLRVNKSLFKNDKITIDYLYRANSELSEIEQKLLEARNNNELALSYFNFLLNRPLDSKVELNETLIELELNSKLEEYENMAIEKREELAQFNSLINIAEDNAGVAKSKYFPGLALAVDYGFQGEKYKFSKDDDYWMASLVLNWNLFNGFQDNAKAEKAELEIKKNTLQIIELQNRIRLQVRDAYQKIEVAVKIYKTAEERLLSSRKAFNIINRKFEEGMASQIEFFDAQNQLLQAQISKLLAEYSFMENYSELEKVSAIVKLEKYH